MNGRLSISRIGYILIALLVLFISSVSILNWRGYQKTIQVALKENKLNLELAYVWDLLQDLDDTSGELLYVASHEYASKLEEFDAKYAQAQQYLSQVMTQVDGTRYFNALDISRMFDTYNTEFHRFYDTLVADETARVYLRGMLADLRKLNTYVRNELGDAIVYHLTYSRENIERTSAALDQAQNRMLFFALICIFTVVFMIRLLVRLVQQPINQLIDRMDHFKHAGSVEGASRFSPTLCSEMRLLADSFDSMAMEIAQKQENERRLARLEMKNMEMKYQLDKARLNMLQAQVNPHFLFNTLNAIYALTLKENAQLSGEMISYLSTILRYSLSSLSFLEIDSELEILSDYIRILKLRFGETIRFNISVDDALRDAEIPCMVIQPLIENSIMHAFNPPSSRDCVDVIIRREGENIRVTVRDNGSGMSPELVNRIHSGEKFSTVDSDSHHGIGLDNVVKRMNILYGPGHIQIESAPEIGTSITLIISPNKHQEETMR